MGKYVCNVFSFKTRTCGTHFTLYCTKSNSPNMLLWDIMGRVVNSTVSVAKPLIEYGVVGFGTGKDGKTKHPKVLFGLGAQSPENLAFVLDVGPQKGGTFHEEPGCFFGLGPEKPNEEQASMLWGRTNKNRQTPPPKKHLGGPAAQPHTPNKRQKHHT